MRLEVSGAGSSAVENTNLKAQRLSFGPAQEAADAFRDNLEAVAAANWGNDTWRVKALVASAVAAVREIQVLEAPHIADPDDVVMARLEKRMDGCLSRARNALTTLAALAQPASRSRVAAATTALNTFVGLHTQILALSRESPRAAGRSVEAGIPEGAVGGQFTPSEAFAKLAEDTA